MFFKTRGIVLHTIKYSETSVISRIYTERFGLQAYIVKGVRSAKSKGKAALLQPLTLLDMDVSQRENKNLQFIKEYRRAYAYQSIPFDTLKATIAVFLLEVISKCIREHETNAELFEFMYESMVALDSAPKLNPDFHLHFLIDFSRHLGFVPHDNWSADSDQFDMTEGNFVTERKIATHSLLSSGDSVLLHQLLTRPRQDDQSKFSRSERKQILRVLVRYFQLHIENFNLKSPDILVEVLD